MTPETLRRHPGAWLTAAVLLALLLGLAVGEATGWPLLRGPLQRQAAKSAQVPVQLDGRFHLRLLGTPQLQVGRLTVGAAQGVAAPHLLQADDALLAWRWADLWRWRQGQPLHIHALHAQALDLQLLRLADGRASWALGSAKPPAAKDAPIPLPRFGRLQVGAGRAVLDDAVLDTALQITLTGGEGTTPPPARPDQPSARPSAPPATPPSTQPSAQAGNARQPPAQTGSAGPGAAPQPSATAQGYRAGITGRWHALPLQFDLRIGGALPLLQADTQDRNAPAVAVRLEGTAGAAKVLFDGRAASLLSARRLEGALRFAGPSLAAVGAPLGVTLPRTPAFQLEGRLSHDDGIWGLRADRATIGRSALGGEFRFDSRASPRRLTGQLTGQRLLLADLGPAVGAPGEGRGTTPPTPAPVAPGRVLPQRQFDLPSLRAMDADVAVAIDALDFGSTALAPLQAVRARLLLQDGVLQLQGLQAGVAGGKVAGNTRLDGRDKTARWDLDLHVIGLDIAGWVRALQAPAGNKVARPRGSAALQRERQAARQGGDQPVRSYLTGVLGGDFKLQGQGNSTAQILASLQGSARLQLRDGTLSHLATEAAGLDLAEALGVLVRGDAPLPLRCARVDLAIDHGVAVIQRAVLDNADSTLRLDGRIDLRHETLALRARSMPKDFSPLTLRAPVLVTGTLAKPQVGLDGRALGARALAATALAVIAAPLAALLPFVDPGEGRPGDPCVDPPAPAKPGR